MNTVIGKISETEKEYVRKLYKRKTALKELISGAENIKTFESKPDVFLKEITSKYKEYSKKYDQWLSEKTGELGWKYPPEKKPKINFNTNEVFYD